MPDEDALPRDMRDLLIRLDQRVADGFQGVNEKLVQMDKRADNLEARVSTIEKESANRSFLIDQHNDMLSDVANLKNWRTDTEGQIKGAERFLTWIKVIGGIVFAALAYLGWQVSFHQTAPKIGIEVGKVEGHQER